MKIFPLSTHLSNFCDIFFRLNNFCIILHGNLSPLRGGAHIANIDKCPTNQSSQPDEVEITAHRIAENRGRLLIRNNAK